MNNKVLGNSIIIVTIIFSIALFLFKSQIDDLILTQMQASGGTCFDEHGNCLHEQSSTPLYVGTVAVIISLIIGLYIMFSPKNIEYKESEHKITTTIDKKHYKEDLKKMTDDEETVIDTIINSQGTIFQSDLVEKSGFNKVKVTRILDRLEGMNLIERKRRGMTNVVILRHK